MRRLFLASLLLAGIFAPQLLSAASVSKNLAISVTTSGAASKWYGAWPNFPQSAAFFPMVVWDQDPTRTLASPGSGTDAAAMAALHINVHLGGPDNGSGDNWPTTGNCSDTGNKYQAMVNAGVYSIMPNQTQSDSNSSTLPHSVANISCVANLYGGGLGLLAGYNGFASSTAGSGDEPSCADMASAPAQFANLRSYDGTRPHTMNMTDWVFNHGICSPSSLNINTLQAVDIGSFDLYPIISPWNGITQTNTAGFQDSMWIQGWSVNQFIANGRAGQPMWAFVDTGTDALSYSAQNGSSCNYSTNTCTLSGQASHEARATAEEVSSEVWMSIINGAAGIEWFCDDSGSGVGGVTFFDMCLGSGSAAATAVAANILYIDTTVLSFAPQLNSPTVGICTMNNGTGYANFATSCSNGILTMSTGTGTVPGSALATNNGGVIYLFADADRKGSAAMTFTLAGHAGQTATIVYDSNSKYDVPHNSTGGTFTLNGSGQFTDTLGANGHDYQPKIYKIQ